MIDRTIKNKENLVTDKIFNMDDGPPLTLEKNLTPEVEAIGQLNFEGNIIPHLWYQNIKFENGKADLISITILAEILYWYRPTYEKDERSGKLISIRKKFKADALQKNKMDLAEQFGLSERQVKDSLARLEWLGLIERDYRTITKDGLKMANVLFIKIKPDRIKEITFSETPSDVRTSYPTRSNVGGSTAERHTNTKNTAKTSLDIKKEKEKEKKRSEPVGSPLGFSLLEFFNKSLEENLPEIEKVPITQKQASYFDALLLKRSEEEIKKVINFSHKDEFWRLHVHTPSYLRVKFDKLKLLMNTPKPGLQNIAKKKEEFREWFKEHRDLLEKKGIVIHQNDKFIEIRDKVFYFESKDFGDYVNFLNSIIKK